MGALLGTAPAFGFGLFLATSAMLKALTLLTGLSMAFGTAAATASVLGMLTGPVGVLAFLAIVPGTQGTLPYWKYRQACGLT